MLTLFRWLLRLTIALIVVLVLAVVLAWYFFVRSLPDYDATLTVSGISAPVEIVRSTEDVPNIFGQTDEDVFFALGLAHAHYRAPTSRTRAPTRESWAQILGADRLSYPLRYARQGALAFRPHIL